MRSSPRPPPNYTLVFLDRLDKGVRRDVWENAHAYPRAWIPQRILPADGAVDAERLLARGAGDLRATSVIERPTSAMLGADGTGSAEVISVDWNEATFLVRATGPSVVVTSDTTYPGWRASVDGKATPIRPANLAMRAVAVPAGTHRLVFSYRPRVLTYGIVLAAAGLTVVIGRVAAAGVATARRKNS